MANIIIPAFYDPRRKPEFGTPLNRNHPLAQGLVGSWTFNEGGGGTVYDTSGNGHDGTLASDVSWTTSSDGPSLLFDASTTGVLCGTFDVGTELTLVVSVKTGGLTANTSILMKRLSAWGDTARWLLQYISGSGLRFGSYDELNQSSVTLSTNTEYVLAVTNEPTGNHFYVDGVLRETLDECSLSNGLDSPVHIGASPVGSGGWDGVIRYVKIYNRALAASEIQRLYYDSFWMYRAEPIPVNFEDAPTGASPTSVMYGPLVGPFGGPI